MTTGELIARVKALYSAGPSSDDRRLSDRHIYSMLRSARAMLLQREANKKRRLSSWSRQVLACICMEQVDRNECPCSVPSGCLVNKSVLPLPEAVSGMLGEHLYDVGPLDWSQRWTASTTSAIAYVGGNKYTGKQTYWFVADGHLYVVRDKPVKWARAVGVFVDPVATAAYGQQQCSPGGSVVCAAPAWEVDFPIDPHLVEMLVQMAYEQLVVWMHKMQQDVENDAQEIPTA